MQRTRGSAGPDRSGARGRGHPLRHAHAAQGVQRLCARTYRLRPARAGRKSAAAAGRGRADAARLVLRQQLCRSAEAALPAAAGGAWRRPRGGDEAAGRGVARRFAGGLRARRIPLAAGGHRPAVQTTQRSGVRGARKSAPSRKASPCCARRWVWRWRRCATARCSSPTPSRPSRQSEREAVQHEIEATQSELEAIMRQVPQWEREHRDAVRDLNRETTGFAIAHLMEEIRAAYARLARGARNTSTPSKRTSRKTPTTFSLRRRRRRTRPVPRHPGADSGRDRGYRASAAMGSTCSSTMAVSAARR